MNFLAPPESRLSWSLNWRGAIAWPNAYWIGSQRSRPGTDMYLATTELNTGVLQNAFSASSFDLRISGTTPDGRLVGNATLDDPRYDDVDPSPFYAVLIDLEAAVIHPIAGLPPLAGAVGGFGRFVFPGDIFAGTPLRVTTGGDCLNVRSAPSTASPTLGCYPDGVLLRLQGDELPSGEWVPVWAPDGQTGWAASQFLAR